MSTFTRLSAEDMTIYRTNRCPACGRNLREYSSGGLTVNFECSNQHQYTESPFGVDRIRPESASGADVAIAWNPGPV